MSIKEFKEVLQSQALKSWFQRLSTDNILKMSAKDIRKKESGKEFNSFYITTQTISDVIEKLSGAQADPEKVTQVFKKLAQTKYGGRNTTGKKISEPYVEGQALYFPRISMDNITTLLDTGFEDVLADARKRDPQLKISDYFQKGHVFGIFPKKIAQVRRSLSANTTLTEQGRNILLGFLNELEAQLEAEDLATSNLKTPKYRLYAKYKKKPSNYLVELQLTEVNEAAGREQAALSKAIRKYLNPGAVTFTSAGIKFTQGEAEQRIRQLMENSVERLVGTRGSPSMLDLIEASLVNTLRGKKQRDKTYQVPKTLVAESKSAKIDTTKITAEIKKTKQQVKKLKQSVKAVPQIKKTAVGLSHTALQRILDATLVERIKQNMGTGTNRTVLNLRTGRFAESVRVVRLSESREGMITAFYTYMKNPYATFSEGGRQQYPRSRDPKLLIAKSIREIAQEHVANRLRAVVV